MKIPLRRLFPATALVCEALSMAALYLSPEVPEYLFYPPLLLALLALLTKLRDRWLLPLIVAVVAGGIFAGFHLNAATGVIVALPMLAVHGLTWLAVDQKRYRYWRVGLAFLEMILAAILSPEAHMFFLIFFFVIVVSLALSFAFLETNFARRDPAGLERPLRPAYLAAVLMLSFVIFLSSLVIFPILPRKENRENTSYGAMPGYSEEVNFQTATFYWAGDSARAVMWLFQPPGLSWEEAIPFGLLRGKALERFNGRTWRQAVKRGHQIGNAAEPSWRLEILREPMPTDVLITPYGTGKIDLANQAPHFRYDTGEWYQPLARGRRVSYVAGIFRDAQRDDVVEDSETMLPERGFERLIALGLSLKKNTQSDRERVERVVKYFNDGTFTASQVPVAAAADKGASPIETFLFETKSGHCELFATSAALLLRAMGIPTRLIVGFRAPKSSRAVLTVRNGDAHAWVEARTAEGWVVLDPTPTIVAPESRWQIAQDFYDWATAYWHRYILGYEFEYGKALTWVLWAAGGICAILALSGLRRLVSRALRRDCSPRRDISQARAYLQRKMRVDGNELYREVAALPGGAEWWGRYLELRFGPRIPAEADVRELKTAARTLLKRAREARSVQPSRRA